MANIPPPGRLTGNVPSDVVVINRFMNELYRTGILGRELLAASEHPFGSFTLSEAATSAVVTFANAQAEATYVVAITPIAETGTPAAGARDIKTIVKTTTGFTVTVAAAPGAGASVGYDWLIRR